MRSYRIIAYNLKTLILVVTVVFYSCSSKPDFIFLGEAEGRAENFDTDIEVTIENIEQLYQKYDTYQLFDGEYFLICSKQSYNNSRYLSRLIRMQDGKQVAAKTFYDCSIDTCNVFDLGSKLLIGLNSLQNNYYNPTSHKCRVVVLNKDLSPIKGSVFSSKKGHTYIQSLFVCSDNTFICTLESAEVIGNPYGQCQYRFRPDFSIVDSTSHVTWSSEYEIVHEQMDFTKPDWGNDLSDEEIAITRNKAQGRDSNDSLHKINSFPGHQLIHKDDIKKEISTIPQNKITPLTDGNLMVEVKGVSFVMIKVEHGTFMMGAPKSEKGSYDRDRPVHKVTLTNDYYIGETEVTQELWVAIMGSNPSEYKEDPRRPVDGITWYDCVDFIEKLNNLTSAKFRRPTEAEWEFAAIGGNKSKGYRYSGSNTLEDVGFGGDNDPMTTDSNGKRMHVPQPVKSLRPNELGIYDMSGNVEEWCEDYWYMYSSKSQTNPCNRTKTNGVVSRGGSRNSMYRDCRARARWLGSDPNYKASNQGLRLALTHTLQDALSDGF